MGKWGQISRIVGMGIERRTEEMFAGRRVGSGGLTMGKRSVGLMVVEEVGRLGFALDRVDLETCSEVEDQYHQVGGVGGVDQSDSVHWDHRQIQEVDRIHSTTDLID
jgi:hypothetical protein